MQRNLWPVVNVRIFVRKIRRRSFGGLRLHFLARFDLDEFFRGCAVLFLRLGPHCALQHGGIVFHRC